MVNDPNTKSLVYILLKDWQEPGLFLPAGSRSKQMTEREYEEKGCLPHLRTYGKDALNYFKFKNVIVPVTQQLIECYPDWFELEK